MLNSSLTIDFVVVGGVVHRLFSIEDRRAAWEWLTGHKVSNGDGTKGELGLFELGEKMKPTFTVLATPIGETNSALLVQTSIHDEPVWLPKSMIHDDSEVWLAEHPTGELVVSRWWARKEGWCDD